MIGDPEMKATKLYDMLPAAASGADETRKPADNQTARTVYVAGPDRRCKLMPTYPMSTGRNVDALLRTLGSIQLTAMHQVATPATWKQCEDVIMTAAAPDEDVEKRSGGFARAVHYPHTTPQPKA